jgi:hypothetical protein
MPISNDAPPVVTFEDLMTEEEVLALFRVGKTALREFRFGGREKTHPMLPYLRLHNRTWFFKNQIAWWLGEMQKLPDLKHLSNVTFRRGTLSTGRPDLKRKKEGVGNG